VNLNALDLNLLRVLDAMLRERNTTRVGERVGLSQPAVSSALNRLRTIVGDALFVREGNRMVPTSFAESLEQPLRQALDGIERALSGGARFDPSKSTRLFRMLGDDYLAEMVVPKLVALLSDRAPGIRFQLLPVNPRSLAQQLAEGSIDAAFGFVMEDLPEWVVRVLAFYGTAIPVAGKSNERLARAGVKDRGMIPLDLFCDMPQVFVGPQGKLAGEEDAALARIGRRRNVVMTVPDFFSVARVAAQTDLLGLLPDKFALSVAEALGLCIYSLPFDLPPIPLHLCWHKRHDDDPEHRWIRGHIIELLEPLCALRHPVSFAARGRGAVGSRRARREASRQA
jgi:DNA-binding transcriptional LysR family regulator